MTKTSLLIAGALVLSGISVANAKSFDILLTRPSKAGNVVLRAGEYSVKLKGSNAVFTENETTDRFTAPVKIENAAKKHDLTAVESTSRNGIDRIVAIDIGGSTETLEFRN